MTTRFDLEEQILECWNVVTDLKVIATEEFNASSEDAQQNAVNGLISLYDIKFQRLFHTMETLVRDRTIK